MVVIAFKSGSDWHYPNWVYRQVIDDIRLASFNEPINQIFAEGAAYGALFINKLEQPIAIEVLRELKKVCEETLRGDVPGWIRTHPHDKEGQNMYLKALRELLSSVEREFEDSSESV